MCCFENSLLHILFSYIFFHRKRLMKPQKIPRKFFGNEGNPCQTKTQFGYLILGTVFMFCSGFIPLVYWVKHLVKLNHEFFSWSAVIKNGASVSANYQNLILAFSSNAVAPTIGKCHSYSSINESSSMKTQNIQKAIWLKFMIIAFKWHLLTVL